MKFSTKERRFSTKKSRIFIHLSIFILDLSHSEFYAWFLNERIEIGNFSRFIGCYIKLEICKIIFQKNQFFCKICWILLRKVDFSSKKNHIFWKMDLFANTLNLFEIWNLATTRGRHPRTTWGAGDGLLVASWPPPNQNPPYATGGWSIKAMDCDCNQQEKAMKEQKGASTRCSQRVPE